jgi:hypothetical protein
MISECQEARNDNIYIDTIQTNPSTDTFEPNYFSSGTYVDARAENVVDDACKYEVNVVKVLIPGSYLPICWILPKLTAGDSSPERFNKTLFEISIEYKGVRYTEPVLWQTSIDTNLYKDPNKIYTTVPPEIVGKKTFHRQFDDYYALYNVDSLTNGFNRTMKKLNDSLPTPLPNYPCFTFNSSVGAWLFHCPEEYMIDSSNPTVNDIYIYHNKFLTQLFGRSFKYTYGVFSSTNAQLTDSKFNNDKYLRADLTDYDVSSFQAPFNNNIYTFNRNVPNLQNLRKWGGINRIEIYSNIPLVKGRYNKSQDSLSGEFKTNESTQDSLLDILYLDDRKLDYAPSNFEPRGYPLWQSISNSGALNKISYTAYAVDIYGNRKTIRVPTGSSMTLTLQLRKVID